MRTVIYGLRSLLLFAILMGLALPVRAQTQADLPGEGVRDMLIVGTLLRFSDANQSGNYAVLRDLASRQFKSEYSAQSLSDAFKSFQNRDLKLDEVAIRDIDVADGGELIHDGVLRLEGHINLARFRLNYLLRFIYEDGAWKLYGLSASTDLSR